MIGSDDELEIVVWNQPQLSGKVIVASDGTIAMPLDRKGAGGRADAGRSSRRISRSAMRAMFMARM